LSLGASAIPRRRDLQADRNGLPSRGLSRGERDPRSRLGFFGVFAGAHLDDIERVRSTWSLRDVIIRQTKSAANSKLFGRGINIRGAIDCTLERILLEENREVGLFVAGDGTQKAEQMIVRNTKAAECAALEAGDPLRCVEGNVALGGGTGIIVVEKGSLELQSFSIETSATSGLQIAREGKVSASRGEIHHNVIGLNLQVPDYDLSTVVNDSIRYYANERNLSSETLPLPEGITGP
jgi:hypothetical protein